MKKKHGKLKIKIGVKSDDKRKLLKRCKAGVDVNA